MGGMYPRGDFCIFLKKIVGNFKNYDILSCVFMSFFRKKNKLHCFEDREELHYDPIQSSHLTFWAKKNNPNKALCIWPKSYMAQPTPK